MSKRPLNHNVTINIDTLKSLNNFPSVLVLSSTVSKHRLVGGARLSCNVLWGLAADVNEVSQHSSWGINTWMGSFFSLPRFCLIGYKQP